MRTLIFSFAFASIIISVFGSSEEAIAEQIYIPVGEARVKKSVLAFADTKYLSLALAGSAGIDTGDKTGLTRAIHDTINGDLDFTNLFKLQSKDAFIEKSNAGLTLDTFRISDWATIGTEFLIKTGITINGSHLTYEMRLYDVLGAKQIVGKRYVGMTNEPAVVAHSAANDIVQALTGKPGIFFTKLAMVCDKTGAKELWVTNFDGSNPKQITNHRTLVIGPTWNPSNKKIAYSMISKNRKNIKNIDLRELDLRTRDSTLLSNRKGINSGATYSPDGKHIALTMSFLGNPEIFLLDPGTKDAVRLTKSMGFDVDPSWSPDGGKITFVSSRSNQPMVYSASISELKKEPRSATRLTFAGKYNATPSWAPSGNKIVFAGYNENHFDLFLMNTDGTTLERLTKDEGNNEDPSFSPDGNFIAFSSNRAGQKNIYIISVDGMYTRRVTFGLGNCVSPRWSPNSSSVIDIK